MSDLAVWKRSDNFWTKCGNYNHSDLVSETEQSRELIANYVANWAENREDPSLKVFPTGCWRKEKHSYPLHYVNCEMISATFGSNCLPYVHGDFGFDCKLSKNNQKPISNLFLKKTYRLYLTMQLLMFKSESILKWGTI